MELTWAAFDLAEAVVLPTAGEALELAFALPVPLAAEVAAADTMMVGSGGQRPVHQAQRRSG